MQLLDARNILQSSGKEVGTIQCWDDNGAILARKQLGNVALSGGVDYFRDVLEATHLCPPVLALKPKH
jgi:hypothetical protein